MDLHDKGDSNSLSTLPELLIYSIIISSLTLPRHEQLCRKSRTYCSKWWRSEKRKAVRAN